MIPRKNLIPLKKELARIRKEGRIYDCPLFGLVVANGSAGAITAKCAFIVSKKIDRRSVVRHEVKRKLAEAVSSFMPRLAPNVELVFLAKQRAVSSSKEELAKELELILKRTRLLQ